MKYLQPLFKEMVVLSTECGYDAIYIDGICIDSDSNHDFYTLEFLGVDFRRVYIELDDEQEDWCGLYGFPETLDGLDLDSIDIYSK